MIRPGETFPSNSHYRRGVLGAPGPRSGMRIVLHRQRQRGMLAAMPIRR